MGAVEVQVESRASPARPLPYLAGRAVRRLRNMTGRFRIIDLQDIREGDLPRVGRKALHLGVMMRAGFTVPSGFVIPTDACEEAIQSFGEQIELDEQFRAAII